MTDTPPEELRRLLHIAWERVGTLEAQVAQLLPPKKVWVDRAFAAEAKADLFQQDREEVVNENSALKAENERLRKYLGDALLCAMHGLETPWDEIERFLRGPTP